MLLSLAIGGLGSGTTVAARGSATAPSIAIIAAASLAATGPSIAIITAAPLAATASSIAITATVTAGPRAIGLSVILFRRPRSRLLHKPL
jgi:hypothetical protein